MHVAGEVLRPELVVGGFAVAALGLAVSLRRLSDAEVPRVAVVAAAFFVVSLIHVPTGGISVHLLLNGLVGVLLVRGAFVAIVVGLVFQTLLFGHGTVTALGFNACSLGLPALAAGTLFRSIAAPGAKGWAALRRDICAALVGGGTVLLSGLVVAGGLLWSGAALKPVAIAVFAAHVPILLIEAFVTLSVVRFMTHVKPELLGPRIPSSPRPAAG
ncbi:MAG: energy-coupling factor ABC transporter permease [Planctomycetota bacterium]